MINITLDEASDFVLKCIKKMKGQEVFIPKLPIRCNFTS